MPSNRPAQDELLIAVREYLEQDIKPQLAASAPGIQTGDESESKSLALNNAIAINLLKILEREFRLRSAQLIQEYDLLRELLPDGDATDDLEALNVLLIELIESPEFFDTNKNVLRALQQISLSKLAIDNPAYSTLRKHRQ